MWYRFFKKIKVTTKIQGGLGNQLFQIAAALNYAKTHNFKPLFTNAKQLNNRYTYWDIFNTKGDLCLESINEKKFVKTGHNIFPTQKSEKNLMLIGYYQSEKFVNPVKNEMENLLFSNDKVNDLVAAEYDKIVARFHTEDLVFIHLRRGDYLKFADVHTNLEMDYYKKALSTLSESMPVVVFSNDQDWCKENLKKHINNPLYYVSEIDYVELLLMSKIKNAIIANSSFSWWGAYLNQHKDKKVLAPKQWFAKAWKEKNPNKSWNAIYCKGWEKL